MFEDILRSCCLIPIIVLDKAVLATSMFWKRVSVLLLKMFKKNVQIQFQKTNPVYLLVFLN